MRKLAVLLISVALAVPAFGSGTNYVSQTTGSDTTGDGTFGNPFATISNALKDAEADNGGSATSAVAFVQVIDSASYQEGVVGEDYLRVRSLIGLISTNEPKPTLIETASGASRVVQMDGGKLEGFRLTGQDPETVNNGAWVPRADADPLYALQVVRNCTFVSNNLCLKIAQDYKGVTLLFDNCVFEDNDHTVIEGRNATSATNVTIIVSNSVFRRNGNTIHDSDGCIFLPKDINLVVANCVFSNNTSGTGNAQGSCIRLGNGGGVNVPYNSLIVSNVFHTNNTVPMISYAAGTGHLLTGNTIFGQGGTETRRVYLTPDPDVGLTVTHNTFSNAQFHSNQPGGSGTDPFVVSNNLVLGAHMRWIHDNSLSGTLFANNTFASGETGGSRPSICLQLNSFSSKTNMAIVKDSIYVGYVTAVDPDIVGYPDPEYSCFDDVDFATSGVAPPGGFTGSVAVDPQFHGGVGTEYYLSGNTPDSVATGDSDSSFMGAFPVIPFAQGTVISVK